MSQNVRSESSRWKLQCMVVISEYQMKCGFLLLHGVSATPTASCFDVKRAICTCLTIEPASNGTAYALLLRDSDHS